MLKAGLGMTVHELHHSHQFLILNSYFLIENQVPIITQVTYNIWSAMSRAGRNFFKKFLVPSRRHRVGTRCPRPNGSLREFRCRVMREVQRKDLRAPQWDLRVGLPIIVDKFDFIRIGPEKFDDCPDGTCDQIALRNRLRQRDNVKKRYGRICEHVSEDVTTDEARESFALENNPGRSDGNIPIQAHKREVQFVTRAEFIVVPKACFQRVRSVQQLLAQPFGVVPANSECRPEHARLMATAWMQRIEQIVTQLPNIDECVLCVWQLLHNAKLRKERASRTARRARPIPHSSLTVYSVPDLFGRWRCGMASILSRIIRKPSTRSASSTHANRYAVSPIS